MRKILFISLLLLVSLPLQAKKMVLVQGYLSNSTSWADSGISRLLMQNNWSYGGEYYYASDGVRLLRPAGQKHQANTFYQVALPTEAPINIQAFYLKAYLKDLRQKYPEERVILVGHSAGGVVARYVMVQSAELNINQLISIASPHLGTESAELGTLVGDSPLSLITPMIGAGTINRSQGLYRDLLPEMPHRFLYWLNRQPHPEAEYISIVRDKSSKNGGDMIVEEKSQYLEHVYDLRRRAYSYVVPASHHLTLADGRLILDLIEERLLKKL